MSDKTKNFEKMLKKNKKANEERVSSMIEHPSAVDRVVDGIIIIICGLIAFCCLVPMWHVLMSSFSDGKTLLAHEGMVWAPIGKFSLEGYVNVFKDNNILEGGIVRGYLNSIFYTAAATLLGWFISCTAGYAMSRKTKLKKFMTLFVIITMLFGGGLVPTYLVINRLGWTGTPVALIIPGCTNAMFIIMMMNAFNAVPHEMYEAARIDGAGHFRTLFIIMLPQARNMSAVIILNSIVGQWNSWLNASIYVANSRALWPLQLFIREVVDNNKDFLQSSNPDYSRYLIQYAAIVAASLPIIVLFPFFQKRLERAVITGGVKG
jgi:putative aldouronate transport system permease protein